MNVNYINPIGVIGHGSNTNKRDQINTTITSGITGHASNTEQSDQAHYKPTGATGHSNNTGSSDQVYGGPTTVPGVTNHPNIGNNTGSSDQINNTITSGITSHNIDSDTTPKKEAITDLYMQDGDDYYIDDTALSNAQMGTGNNETADSAVVSGGINGSSETNSNINTGVFGGSARAAHPGYSLW